MNYIDAFECNILACILVNLLLLNVDEQSTAHLFIYMALNFL